MTVVTQPQWGALSAQDDGGDARDDQSPLPSGERVRVRGGARPKSSQGPTHRITQRRKKRPRIFVSTPSFRAPPLTLSLSPEGRGDWSSREDRSLVSLPAPFLDRLRHFAVGFAVLLGLPLVEL